MLTVELLTQAVEMLAMAGHHATIIPHHESSLGVRPALQVSTRNGTKPVCDAFYAINIVLANQNPKFYSSPNRFIKQNLLPEGFEDIGSSIIIY